MGDEGHSGNTVSIVRAVAMDTQWRWLTLEYTVVVIALTLGSSELFLPQQAPGHGVAKFFGLSLLSIGTVYGTFWLVKTGASAEKIRSVVRISLIFGVYGIFVAGIVAISHALGNSTLFDSLFLLAAGGLGGEAIGVLVGDWYTDLQQAKQETQKRLQREQDVTKRFSVLYRVFRHNLRTQVNILLGYTALLEASDHADEADEYVDIIQEHLTQLESLAENANRLRRVWETEDQRETKLVSELYEDGLIPLADEFPEATVRIETPPDCPVDCHPFAHWALEEAAKNAIIHTGDDSTVEVTARRNGSDVVIEVTDDGDGIPELEQEALAAQSETALTHGRGLGLQTIYWTVRASGGEVDLSDGRSGGAVVSMRFPLASQSE
ncbi:HAMP domain-containing histidine kinase [Haloferax mediterranei ATCC 33500]|uniref:histidine kinase n=1 Tax=Haloferax mediterranei (strain ATCC 33500 / DSM 1411 / JCM 8866 / NBRC 14739 / NCIMB 2177 / R-4) TaxID=523841 RepID=I3R497_HALMT|nr:HAMP domain-containing sensor histidine kinase [Haloferax mediterranei]AFK19057.1 putative redox sensing protein [Haloferax mediterranei ATCC 33500]AHZ21584.1 redox sensing protein [Haloferax mediterranei ATCC 33500]EMA04048.1 putative redox sensing protein [Haloferax mediterranei ATCC 33500]MDX5989147.1 HAMP domain-containing sensor histidine kinase [Haloferax mediterranei ATCC 33500]QCQ75530.1 HAMP domain-containing histidine kinase [Haloferax mediterranei ATCC 33500]